MRAGAEAEHIARTRGRRWGVLGQELGDDPEVFDRAVRFARVLSSPEAEATLWRVFDQAIRSCEDELAVCPVGREHLRARQRCFRELRRRLELDVPQPAAALELPLPASTTQAKE